MERNQPEESRFLKTIGQSAKKHKNRIINEIKEIEEQNLQKAQKDVIQESNKLIEKEVASMRGKILIEVSKKSALERKKLFLKKKNLMEEIFKQCQQNLIKFTASTEYPETLKKSVKKISEVLLSDDVEFFVKESDVKFEKDIKNIFGDACKISSEKDIKIGGIKSYSKKLNLIVDETLDAKLDSQKDWAIENFGINL